MSRKLVIMEIMWAMAILKLYLNDDRKTVKIPVFVSLWVFLESVKVLLLFFTSLNYPASQIFLLRYRIISDSLSTQHLNRLTWHTFSKIKGLKTTKTPDSIPNVCLAVDYIDVNSCSL